MDALLPNVFFNVRDDIMHNNYLANII